MGRHAQVGLQIEGFHTFCYAMAEVHLDTWATSKRGHTLQRGHFVEAGAHRRLRQ